MAQQPEELEQVPPVGHVRVVYLGPVAPHWEVQGVFGERQLIDDAQKLVGVRDGGRPPLLYRGSRTFSFYPWGERECCLPKGTMRTTLMGKFPNLKAGDVLVFAEKLGPRTGYAEDADRTHHWAVRLTDVRLDSDPCGGLFSASTQQ